MVFVISQITIISLCLNSVCLQGIEQFHVQLISSSNTINIVSLCVKLNLAKILDRI